MDTQTGKGSEPCYKPNGYNVMDHRLKTGDTVRQYLNKTIGFVKEQSMNRVNRVPENNRRDIKSIFNK